MSLLIPLAQALQLPNFFGADLDALNDCLRDLAADSVKALSSTGLVLVLRHYDTFVAREPPVCQGELRPAARSKSASTGRDSG